MKKLLFFPIALLSLVFTSCSEEPANMECDIESVSIHFDNPELFFDVVDDTLKSVATSADLTYDTDSIGFKVKTKAVVGSYGLTIATTPGATVYFVEADGSVSPYRNGTPVDFSDEKIQVFRIVSEDGVWHRDYKICVVHDAVSNLGHRIYNFSFDGNYSLYDPNKTIDDKGNYFVWQEVEENLVNDIFGSESWKCGNPGFKLSKSSAKALEYPSVPCFGEGPDGTDCIKLETMDTGAFGKMVNMRIASGSLFTGYFDVANALKDARKATQFGVAFKHKPVKFSVWLKCEMGAKFQDKAGKAVEGVVDEPDAYVVVYRNQDENGNRVLLDGNDVLSSKYIVGMARLPHYYDYEEVDGRTVRHDKLSDHGIHGVTNEWQKFEMDVEYTEELDDDLLANNGYNIIIGFSSSWQGAYFQGAVGSKLWIDNIEIECEK